MRRRAQPKHEHGENALSEIEAITIVLESGRKATFSIESELAVSGDPDDIYAQAQIAHSRFAFWAYQAERALSALRTAETAFAAIEGTRRFAYAKTIKDEDRYASSAVIEGMLASDPEVQKGREGLNSLREHWNILRSVAAALDHRTHLLRRLLARDQDATRG